MFASHSPLTDRVKSAAWCALLGVLAAGLVVPWGCTAGPAGGGGPANPESPDLTIGPENGSTAANPPGSAPALEGLGDAEAGGLLYHAVARGCYVCHGDDARGTALAPGVGDVTASEIRGALLAGGSHTGGPQLDLTAQDVADLVAFLEDPGPDPPDMNTNGPDSGSNGLS